MSELASGLFWFVEDWRFLRRKDPVVRKLPGEFPALPKLGVFEYSGSEPKQTHTELLFNCKKIVRFLSQIILIESSKWLKHEKLFKKEKTKY